MLHATTRSGFVELRESAISDLRKRLSGTLVLRDDPTYDEARTVWNRMIDRRPALIARCVGAEDVVTALRFAREHDPEELDERLTRAGVTELVNPDRPSVV